MELKDLLHGSERLRGLGFIDSQSMNASIGDKHWLGDGYYFYDQLFWAYRWIRNMFKEPESKDDIIKFEDLISKYIILKANIKVDSGRVFDIDNDFEHKCIFKKFSEKLEQSKEFSERFKNQKISDGVVLNIMFSEYKYIDKYDVVIALFIDKKQNNIKTRLGNVLEKQICVKNPNIIYDISERDFKDDFDNLCCLVKEFDKYKGTNNYYNKRKNYSKKVF